jgi:hypothetical protein
MSAKAKSISQERYDKLKSLAVGSQPIRKVVPLVGLRVINSGAVELNGSIIPMTDTAFKQLAKILGVPVQFQGRVEKLFGEDAKSEIVNKMKSALIINGMSTITIVANPQTKCIVGFLDRESRYTSNQAFLGLIEGVITDHGLDVRDFTVDPTDGGMTISCFNEKAEYMVGGLKDEVFNGGVTFQNSLDGGMIVSPYMNRLICANGMIGEAFSESLKVKNLNGPSIEKFRAHLDQMAKKSFKPKSFEERVNQAIKTKASFAELEAAADLIMRTSGAKPEEISSWVPYRETMAEYAKIGTPTITLSRDQKKNAKTGTSIWEVVNGLTHYSTHQHGLKIGDYDRREVQKEAGALLSEIFDMENQVISPFA